MPTSLFSASLFLPGIMMRLWKSFLVCLMLFWWLPALASSPEGLWTAIDDKTNQKRALVKLILKNGTLTGRIIDVYPQPGDTGICSKCPGMLKNKPIKGLRIVWGLKDAGSDLWTGGYILDAKTGKIYRLKIKVKNNTLFVRGYIGTSWLGRTQVWTR